MTTSLRTEQRSALPLPPELPGLPVLGHVLEFQRDPVGLFRRGYEQLGPMFALRLGPKRAAVLLGPEANRFFFTETSRLLSMPEVYRFLIPMFGEPLLFCADNDAHLAQREVLVPAFHGPTVDGYMRAIITEVEAWLATLGEEGQFELVSSFGVLALFNALRAFMGDQFRGERGQEFWELFRDLAGGIEYVLPTNLPLPRFIKRDRARVRLQALVRDAIAERRGAGGRQEAWLQTVLDARDAGHPVGDQTIINLLLGVIFAGHETTQGQACWALILLLQHPDYLERVLAEQAIVLGTAARIDAPTLKQLTQLEWAIREAERLQPALRVIPRYVAQDFDLLGYHVPRGWITIASPAVSHRLPDAFADPERYDPDRFAPPRSEDRTPFSLIGFGGGIHRCLGMYFAYSEMKILLTLLLQRYELELVDRDPKPVGGPRLNQPEEPCWVRYRRRPQDSQPRGDARIPVTTG
jgi:sterol 14alpha-demethylase